MCIEFILFVNIFILVLFCCCCEEKPPPNKFDIAALLAFIPIDDTAGLDNGIPVLLLNEGKPVLRLLFPPPLGLKLNALLILFPVFIFIIVPFGVIFPKEELDGIDGIGLENPLPLGNGVLPYDICLPNPIIPVVFKLLLGGIPIGGGICSVDVVDDKGEPRIEVVVLLGVAVENIFVDAVFMGTVAVGVELKKLNPVTVGTVFVGTMDETVVVGRAEEKLSKSSKPPVLPTVFGAVNVVAAAVVMDEEPEPIPNKSISGSGAGAGAATLGVVLPIVAEVVVVVVDELLLLLLLLPVGPQRPLTLFTLKLLLLEEADEADTFGVLVPLSLLFVGIEAEVEVDATWGRLGPKPVLLSKLNQRRFS